MVGLRYELLLLSCFIVSTASCSKPTDDNFMEPFEVAPDTTEIFYNPEVDPLTDPQGLDLDGVIEVSLYAELGFKHQSVAVCGDYGFFVKEGRGGIRMYDLVNKTEVHSLSLKGESGKVYHCNQSTFGVEKYDPSDYFPPLYISQRARSERRCFTEVFRIIPLFNSDSTAFLAFRAEKVQEIFFPPMSTENSLGNVNCVIDSEFGWMYTYSRNNDASDDNYLKCKISRFSIPDIHQPEVFLQDSDIKSSFILDVEATNMQGGCIVDGRLYIGQGYPAVRYIYLNVVDIKEQKLVKRYDLLANGVDWEPEGCFYYDGNVMLSHTDGISRIMEEE